MFTIADVIYWAFSYFASRLLRLHLLVGLVLNLCSPHFLR